MRHPVTSLLRPALCAALVLALAGGLAPSAADARAPMQTVVQDDAALLHGSDTEVPATMRQLRALGVDRVRLTAGWSVIAPEVASARRPRFAASDPAAYPEANWHNLDRAVTAAHAAGLDVMIDIAFWAPLWATSRATELPRARSWINPAAYAKFATAVARRYSGGFVAAGSAEPLPAVRMWTIWNEPNFPSFFDPQYRRIDGRLVPESPHQYRRMVEASYPAIKAVQPDSVVLVGGITSGGIRVPTSTRTAMPPLRFLREYACVDEQYRPLTTENCRDFRPLQGDGFSYHPYSLRTEPAATDRDNPDTARMGDLGRLTAALDRLVALGRIDPKLAKVYLTEYGYDTNPPDTVRRFSLEQQALFINWGEYLAWRDRHVVMWPQFLVRDMQEDTNWQTGLYFADGSPKPAVQSFQLALFADACLRRARGRRRVRIWGRVRPGGRADHVRIEEQLAGSWQTARGPFATQPDGAFMRIVRYRAGARYRVVDTATDGTETSGLAVAPVGCA